MNEQTQRAMGRYRELGSSLEASRVVLWEFCGPTITYGRGPESLKPPGRVANKEAVQTANTDSANCACGKPVRPRGTDCWKCYRERSK
jgi:hypothetical protein